MCSIPFNLTCNMATFSKSYVLNPSLGSRVCIRTKNGFTWFLMFHSHQLDMKYNNCQKEMCFCLLLTPPKGSRVC